MFIGKKPYICNLHFNPEDVIVINANGVKESVLRHGGLPAVGASSTMNV